MVAPTDKSYQSNMHRSLLVNIDSTVDNSEQMLVRLVSNFQNAKGLASLNDFISTSSPHVLKSKVERSVVYKQ